MACLPNERIIGRHGTVVAQSQHFSTERVGILWIASRGGEVQHAVAAKRNSRCATFVQNKNVFHIGERAAIKEDAIVSAELAEVTPDLLISATGRDPVAIFLTQSATRVQDAIFLQMAALYEAKQPLSVVALVESERTLTRDMQRRAGNRLTAVTTWEGDQIAAIQRIEREAIGAEATRN